MASTIINIDDSVSKAASDSELEFQTFNFAEGTSKEKYKPVPTAAPGFFPVQPSSPDWNAPAPAAQQSETPAGNHPIYSLEYYMQFFDVDTDQVLKRIVRSFMFWKGDFLEFINPNPDLYGPFWIATTVVFVLFVTGNISSSVLASKNDTEFVPDFKMLSLAASSIYSYVFLGSLIVWGILRYYQVAITLLQIICIYGYAMAIFIPISVACIAPQGSVKWSLSGIAFVFSGAFIVLNLWTPMEQSNKGLAFFMVLGLLACHLGLTLLFKFVFFTYANVKFET